MIARWIALAAALAALNFALTFANLWPTAWIRPRAALAIELAVAVLLAAIAIPRCGPLSRRALGLVSAVFVVLALTHYAEVMARELYGRPINLYYDAPHVPRVVAMFAEATPAGCSWRRARAWRSACSSSSAPFAGRGGGSPTRSRRRGRGGRWRPLRSR